MKHVEVVCALIINENKEIFICQRGQNMSLPLKWEFPGGKVETNETHKQTIIREIKEELESDIEPIKHLCSINHKYKDIPNPFSITLHAYLCKLIKGELKFKEHVQSKWIKVNELSNFDFADADKTLIHEIKKCQF